jgi:hypothetical protein
MEKRRTELKPPHLTEAHRVLTLAASLAGPDGVVSLAALVRVMVAHGYTLRGAQGTLEMLAGRRLAIITDRKRPSIDSEAALEIERGIPWSSGRQPAFSRRVRPPNAAASAPPNGHPNRHHPSKAVTETGAHDSTNRHPCRLLGEWC